MPDKITFAIGSYTEKQGHAPKACGEGIVIVTFDEENGKWGENYTLRDLNNPSYLAWNNQNQYLYAVTESTKGNGQVQAYSIDEDNIFQNASLVTGPGKAGCHLDIDYSNKKIYAVSYVDGSIKGYHLVDGELGESIFYHTFNGSGPNKQRQESSHAHQIRINPKGDYFYICDLGSDKIWMFDRSEINVAEKEALIVPAGYGPRHMELDSNGEYAFILCELIPRLLVAKINQSDGTFSIIQDLPAVDPENENIASPAAVKIHPSGNSLVISSRFDDTISLFKIIRNSVSREITLDYFDNFSSRGNTPRDITFSPSGKWLLIANQDSSDVQVCSFDPESGLPTDVWTEPLKTGTPICIIGLAI